MKHLVKFSGIVVALLLLFTACKKEALNLQNVAGIYTGTITGLQVNNQGGGDSKPATTEISVIGDYEIQLHCYAEGFDTIFNLNCYLDNNSAYVCFIGKDFEEMYGHGLGEGHSGGMMDDMHKGETQWMHHMSEEHQAGDEHFGGFDMENNSFSFTFQMNPDSLSDDMHFEGIKQ